VPDSRHAKKSPGQISVSTTATAAGRRREKLYQPEDPLLEARILRDPRPKIFVTGHLGSWEVTMLMLALRVPEAGAAIARRVDNPFVNELVRRLRVSRDSQWIEKRGAVAEAHKRLRKGESIAMLLDENGGPNGPFATFFGRPASTRKTAALFSIMTGAPIVIGAAVRSPSTVGFLFRLAVLEPGLEDHGDPRAVSRLTQEMVRVYETWVREDPLQWRWLHWRWKSRPGGTEETYSSRDLAECFGHARVPTGRHDRARARVERKS
jgi:KDO2-lipid IV(A) lauroyltransferase